MNKLKSLLLGMLLLSAPTLAYGQCSGQPAGGYVCGNGLNAQALPGFYPQATLLDAGFGTAQGMVLNRTGSGWVATVAPSLGHNGGTGGSLTLNGATSGAATISVPAAAGSVLFQIPGTNGSNNQVLATDGSGHLTWESLGGTGTVTSVGLSMPGIFAVSGSPVTVSGTLAASLNTQSANSVWAGPTTGSAAAPTFRALVGADLPNPSGTTLGGIQSTTGASHQWVSTISTAGVPGLSQPAFSDISGVATGAQLPTPSTSTLGGVESFTSVAHQWINQISTSGVPSSTQPAFSDISGATTLAQLPTITNNTVLANNSGGSAVPSALSASNVLDMVGSMQGQVLYRGASGWSALPPGTNGQVLQSGGAAANPLWATISGTGTVTQINAGSGITLVPSPITTTGSVALSSISTGNVLANVSGSSAAPSATTPSAVLDTIGSTTGNVLYRSSGGWSSLAPGSNGQVLTMGSTTPAWNNPVPTVPNNTIMSNVSGSTAVPVPNAPTSIWDSFCSSSVGQIWVRMSSAWGCTNAGYANPVWWGADPTGSTDSTSAFNAALAASNNVRFPPGKFKLNSAISYTLTAGSSVTIAGAGQDVTVLDWPNASGGLAISYGANRDVSSHIRDMTFATTQNGGGNAISLTTTATAPTNAYSDVANVTFRGDDGYAINHYWTNAININTVSNVNINDINVFGGAGSGGFSGGYCTGTCGGGVSIVGTATGPSWAVQINVQGSAFNYTTSGIMYGSYVQGVTVNQSNFTGGAFGIEIPSGAAAGLLQLSVTNSQFNDSSAGIDAFTSIDAVQYMNNLILVPANATGISHIGQDAVISGNVILCGGASTTNGLIVGATVSGVVNNVIGNHITGCTTGLFLNSSSTNVSVQSNSVGGNTNPVINSGTTNKLLNNPGYNPVSPGGVSVTVGASGANYTAGASPETYYMYGGSGVSVNLPGIAACTATPCSVNLEPYGVLSVSWTGSPPTMGKQVH